MPTSDLINDPIAESTRVPTTDPTTDATTVQPIHPTLCPTLDPTNVPVNPYPTRRSEARLNCDRYPIKYGY